MSKFGGKSIGSFGSAKALDLNDPAMADARLGTQNSTAVMERPTATIEIAPTPGTAAQPEVAAVEAPKDTETLASVPGAAPKPKATRVSKPVARVAGRPSQSDSQTVIASAARVRVPTRAETVATMKMNAGMSDDMALNLKRRAIDQGRPWDLSAVVRDALDELFDEIDRLGDHDAKIERIVEISKQPAPRGAALRATCLRIDQRDRLLRWQTNVPITMASAIRAAVDEYLANHPVAEAASSAI